MAAMVKDDARMQSYAQHGEDVLLWEHFRGRSDGFFVEAGANHPTLCSQTWLLEQRGWKGILVEPILEKFDLIQRERPGSRVVHLALGAPEQRGKARFNVAAGNDGLSGLMVNDGVTVARVEDVEVRTLDEVLAEAGNPQLDLVSIDVEGVELDVLRGFSLARHRPAVLLVEDHLQKMKVHRHITRQGYRLVKRTGCNNWYVPRGAEFRLTTAGERLGLRKEIWLDTPVRCVRYFFKRWRAAKKPAPAMS
jgi:FkbM family methyltransferase